jgi:hypothetical protein
VVSVESADGEQTFAFFVTDPHSLVRRGAVRRVDGRYTLLGFEEDPCACTSLGAEPIDLVADAAG